MYLRRVQRSSKHVVSNCACAILKILSDNAGIDLVLKSCPLFLKLCQHNLPGPSCKRSIESDGCSLVPLAYGLNVVFSAQGATFAMGARQVDRWCVFSADES